MFIFSIIAFIYSEYIVFYVDYFSENFICIIPYPDDFFEEKHTTPNLFIPFKFYIMAIIVANFICCMVIERVLVPKLNKCWTTRKYKRIQMRLE